MVRVLGEHEARRPAPRAYVDDSPDPLVRLDGRVGLRSPPIAMVVMHALHEQRRACATRGGDQRRSGAMQQFKAVLGRA